MTKIRDAVVDLNDAGPGGICDDCGHVALRHGETSAMGSPTNRARAARDCSGRACASRSSTADRATRTPSATPQQSPDWPVRPHRRDHRRDSPSGLAGYLLTGYFVMSLLGESWWATAIEKVFELLAPIVLPLIVWTIVLAGLGGSVWLIGHGAGWIR